MKLLFLLFLLPHAFGNSVVPERVITPPLDLHSTQNREVTPGIMEVLRLSFTPEGEVVQLGETYQLPGPIFNTLLDRSRGVYEVLIGGFVASAVHIGFDLVLTNHHVLTNESKNPVACNLFQLKEKGSNNLFPCHKVHFCDIDHDVCLIEMAPVIKVTRACRLCRKETQKVSLKDGGSLRLRALNQYDDDAVLTAIGNTLGLGLHASQGKGQRYFYPFISFYAPTTTGNSGGALLNEEGELIGVVKSGTVLKISTDPNLAFNMAVSSVKVIELARSRLQNDPKTLEKFNQSVIE